MIDIKAEFNKSDITLDFNGHAQYASKGSDIVCAGISALYCTLVLALANLGEKIYTYDRAVTVKSAGRKARTIIDTILVGIKGIQRSYPDYVNLTVDSREQTAQKRFFGVQPGNSFGNIALLQLFADDGAESAGFTDRRKKKGPKPETGAGEGPKNQNEKEVYKVFETKDQYQDHIDSIIGGRLKDDREQKSRLEKLGKLIDKLVSIFGAKDEDELCEKLSAALDEVGMQNEQNEDYEKFADAINRELEKLPEELKNSVDAVELAHDEDFTALVASGLSVAEAVEIMDEAKRSEAEEAKGRKAVQEDEEDSGSALRPAENALSTAGAARISKNAEYLTNDDIAGIVKRVARGEKIKF